jgi:dolichol-phosphate mannosyltransferase
MIELSIVIPVKDEEENLSELIDRLITTTREMRVTFEIIFITDINKDQTYEILKSQNNLHSNIKTVKLSNAFGHHSAVIAGLEHTSGNTIVIMDGDLQDYPEDIPKMYNKMNEGYDVVYGIKEKKNDSFIRNIFSKLFLKVLSRLSDNSFEFNTNMFRIISRRTVDELLKFKEREPSLTALISLIGFPTTKVKVTSGIRKRGKTKYSYFRQINFAISFLISFTTKPLRIISMLGFIVSCLSFVYLIIVVAQKLIFGIDQLGWPTIVSLITFFAGIQLFSLGIAGEYIGRIFLETKNRPLYIIENKIGKFK